jgi:CheY-like chemotaxis protein
MDSGNNNPGLNVYVIDEDEKAIEMMSDVLRNAGHTVTAYKDSSDALSNITKHKPDCVATNLMMPGLDGLALCKEIRSNAELAHTKVLVVSSKSYDLDRKRAFEFGADGYITKPLNQPHHRR